MQLITHHFPAVFAKNGKKGMLCEGEPAPEGRVVVRFGARRFAIPPHYLMPNADGSYSLPLHIPDSPEKNVNTA